MSALTFIVRYDVFAFLGAETARFLARINGAKGYRRWHQKSTEADR